MTALPRPVYDSTALPLTEAVPRHRLRTRSFTSPASQRTRRRSRRASVRAFPAPSQQLPWGVKILLVLQKGSNVLTFGAIAAMLGAYALTIAPPLQWNRDYHRLIKLQRDERDLRASTAALQEQLARQALKSNSGLVTPGSHRSPLFLTPTPAAAQHQPSVPPAKSVIQNTAQSSLSSFLPAPGPLAY